MPKSSRFEEVFAKRSDHIKLGLERIKRAYDYLGRPSFSTPSVLIAGTNGKGSTSGFLWGLYVEDGYNVGLYTSPHLVDFCERIQTSHQHIDDDYLESKFRSLKTQLPESIYEELSFFEIATLMALMSFHELKTDINIIEVGMGGRWDATNIIEPFLSIITGVDIDHQEFLGDTVQQIAFEKAGIIKRNGKLLLGTGIGKDAKSVIVDQAVRLNCEIFVVEDMCARSKNIDLPDYIETAPEFLKENYMLATFAHSIARTGFIEDKLPQKGARLFSKGSKVIPSLVGRFQQLNIEIGNDNDKGWTQQIIVDVCHNVQGVRALVDAIKQSGVKYPTLGFVTIFKDKNLNGMLDILTGFLDPIVLFKTNSDRSLDKSDLNDAHRHLEVFESFDLAWQSMIHCRESSFSNTTWVACGSVHGIGEVIEYFGAYPQKVWPDEGLVLHGSYPLRLRL